MSECQLCPPVEYTTPVYHHGQQVRVYECDTCTAPVVVLCDHVETPADDLESYALGVARGLFGPSALLVEADHGTVAEHFNRHIAVPTK